MTYRPHYTYRPRPSDLSVWERIMWAMRDELTNQYWLEAREHRKNRVDADARRV